MRREVFGLLRVYFSFIHSIMGHRADAVFLQLLAWRCWGSINLSSIVSLYPHQTAQAQLQLAFLSTVNTPLLPCCRQCQWRPHSVAPNFHAERSSPQTAGDVNISNYTILNTFKLQRIWLYAARPDWLNPLSVVNSTLTVIQSKTWTRFTTSNRLKTLQMRSLNHRHLFCRGRKHTLAPALHWAITLLRHGNATLRVALRRTHRTIPTTRLRRVESTNISSVGSRRNVWRRTMTICWRKKTPALRFPTFKNGDGVQKLVASMPDDQALWEWELHTPEDMWWYDNHQWPIKYWSRDIIKSMRWLMREPAYAEHLI